MITCNTASSKVSPFPIEFSELTSLLIGIFTYDRYFHADLFIMYGGHAEKLINKVGKTDIIKIFPIFFNLFLLYFYSLE